ncbi:MAG: thiamine phosphate synthase [Beijerinckiaceae bacterium]
MVEEARRLYLITPPVADAAGFAAKFVAALDTAEIACVLLRVSPMDHAATKKVVRALAPLAQDRGVACLVEDPQLAVHTDVDGAHVTGVGDKLEAALASLKPGNIVGVGAITGRDDAMTAAEAGVDYLMFGDADGTQSFAEILEQVNWWAEIFNVPCVAYARKHEEIAEFARAGADFVALCDAVWNDPRGTALALLGAAEVLANIRESTEC